MRTRMWIRAWVCVGLCFVAPAISAMAAKDNKEGTSSDQPAPESKSEPENIGAPAFEKGNRIDQARIRVELTPVAGAFWGIHERDDDFGLRTNIDYEFPIVEHLTISPRLIPIMYYHQADGSNSVWATGIGVVFRGYSNGKEQRGVFGEAGLHFIGQSAKFDGNSGSFNFMEEAGIGYMFKTGWHVAAKISHISNASIA